jgi:hypothetical protein
MTGERGERLSRLLAEGERLGWIFRDRRQFYRPFAEAPPALVDVPPTVHGSVVRAKTTSFALILVLVILWVLAASCFGLVFAGSLGPDDPASTTELNNAEMREATIILAVVVTAAVLVLIALLVTWRVVASGREGRVRRVNRAEFERAVAAWEDRRRAYNLAEQQRVDALAEWGAAGISPGVRRIDVVGGNLWGWEALLTVFGASALATRGGLTLVDLSGEAVGAELVQAAVTNGMTVDVQQLPAGLADSDLLVGLDRNQLTNTIVESMHGGAQRAERATRSMDHRLLDLFLDALGDNWSMGRIVAAVRLAMGEPGPTPELSAQERARIADELFSDEYRRQVHENLRRIESFLYPLRSLGSGTPHRSAAQLTCIAVTADSGAHSELLKDLVVQWLAHRVTTSPDTSRTLVIAGADDLHRSHIERIADICDRRSVRLVMLFRHLREASLQVLGAGAVAFMKLGNHEEATRAADFIGRQHKFVLTSITTSLGGSHTHTSGTNDSVSKGYGGPARWYTGILPLDSATSWNSGRSWGTSQSFAETTNFNSSEASNRVYEYTVEPRTLQHLPDYGMLLVESSPGGPVLQAVECNPDIVSLPRSSMQPLPAEPVTLAALAANTQQWPARG